MSEKILRIAEVRERVGLGRTTLWRLERAGQFPPRRQVAAGIVGWVESEVTNWIRARPVIRSTTQEHDNQ